MFKINFALKAMSDGYWVIDRDAKILDVNETYSMVTGYSKEAIIGNYVYNFDIDHSTLKLALERINSLLQNSFSKFESRHKCLDGRIIDFDVSVIHTEHENNLYFVVVFRDITDKKIYEQRLKESERNFRLISESIDEVFWLSNADGSEIIYINPAFERISSLRSRDLYLNSDLLKEFVHEDDRQFVEDEYKKYMSTNKFDLQFRICRTDGVIRWVRVRLFPVCDFNGKITSHTGVATDITETKLINIQLEEGEYKNICVNGQKNDRRK